VIVECLTDNRNRSAGEVRAAFSKNGGNMGESNSVSFLWDRVGEIRYPLATAAEDAMLEAAIDAGADDCQVEDDAHVILCAMENLTAVSQSLAARYPDPASAKFVWRPQTTIPVTGDAAQTLVKLLSILEDLDDVQNVYANYEVSAEELEKLAG
jgi:YebC/PmpR family DNA-binding regulatory protein